MRRAAHSILAGQILCCFGLLVCILIKPQGLAINAGVSYYGIYRETAVPYAFALLSAAYGLLHASTQLPPEERLFKLAFRSFVVLVIIIVLTPYAVGRLVADIHTSSGAALFSLQLLLSGWLAWRLHFVWWSVALSLAELAAGIAALIYLSPAHGFLLQSQCIFQIAFGLLLFFGIEKLSTATPVTKQSV